MRIMIDTNILISAILFPDSTPSKLVEEVLENYNLVLCSQIIDELHKVFNRKFENQIPNLEKFLSQLGYGLVYTPLNFDQSDYPNLRDKQDLPILVSAILGGIDYLVTGDKDFFEVETDKIEIISAREFLNNH